MTSYKEELITFKNGIQIWTEIFGKLTDPVILLIGGSGCQCKIWRDSFCEILVEQNYCVIRYDQRDTGNSSKIDYQLNPYTVLNLAEDAISVLEYFNIQSAHIVGMSMGGEIGLFICAFYPKYAKSLTLIATSTNFKVGFDALLGNNSSDPLSPPSKDFIAISTQKVDFSKLNTEEKYKIHYEFTKILNGKIPINENAVREEISEIISRTKHYNYMQNHWLAMQSSYCDHAKAPGLVSQKTLIIHGDNDVIFGLDHAHALQQSIKHSKLQIIPGMGHYLNQALFPEITKLIIGFIQE